MSSATGQLGGDTIQLVVFSLAGEHYALPIATVSEIIRFTPPRSIVTDLPEIQGVINLRGKIIPIFELASRLGLHAASERGKIIVVEVGAGPVGVMVDDVDEVLTVAREQIEPSPAGDGDTGIVRHDDRLIVVLDADDLLAGYLPA